MILDPHQLSIHLFFLAAILSLAIGFGVAGVFIDRPKRRKDARNG